MSTDVTGFGGVRILGGRWRRMSTRHDWLQVYKNKKQGLITLNIHIFSSYPKRITVVASASTFQGGEGGKTFFRGRNHQNIVSLTTLYIQNSFCLLISQIKLKLGEGVRKFVVSPSLAPLLKDHVFKNDTNLKAAIT